MRFQEKENLSQEQIYFERIVMKLISDENVDILYSPDTEDYSIRLGKYICYVKKDGTKLFDGTNFLSGSLTINQYNKISSFYKRKTAKQMKTINSVFDQELLTSLQRTLNLLNN